MNKSIRSWFQNNFNKNNTLEVGVQLGCPTKAKPKPKTTPKQKSKISNC